MYCKNCGEPFSSHEATVCVRCGVPKGVGNNFCPYCGTKLYEATDNCPNCGTYINNRQQMQSNKSKLVAGLLAIFLGTLGIHNFYLGYTSKGVIQLTVTVVCSFLSCCTFGISSIGVVGIGIWAIIEAVMILTGNINVDADGLILKD